MGLNAPAWPVLAASSGPTAKGVLIAILLVLAVLVELLACVGVLLMPNLNDRLHFVTPASSVGPVLVAGAIVAKESFDHQGIAAVLVAVFLAVFGPVVSHATGRVARIRAAGDWRERASRETVHRP
jgi:monovalent cation/proton antiporter MnhG/PhaG subunit